MNMTSDIPLNELGEFLKRRRSKLSPRAVGLPETGGPRRVAGLRREEVAQLAGKPATRIRRRGRQKVQPQLQRVLDDLTSTPALVQGRRGDILAWNSVAQLRMEAAKYPEDPHLIELVVNCRRGTSSSPSGGAIIASQAAPWARRPSTIRSSESWSWTGTR
ncbi:hypothetical protein STRIP9103_09199 [Streptomyces ipomoeae 91-03]|jgi:hypothetical protein|uniref:MmyB-like transcription regulator ligand binding domain-containing protein n=1 Tax=Streptomyces ipomoeae 91-03 TaxID=698759 RepID=L1KPB6_9ACTN|nr:hypothetical protein STRIP9103_09199 [Streptomyces ipomoeae 91-03]